MKKNILILLSLITFTAMAQTKGKFEVLDLKDFKLHVYYTNDALNDASYIVEGKTDSLPWNSLYLKIMWQNSTLMWPR